MCSGDERSSLILMKVLCTLLIALLGVASPLSLWADVVFPCTQLNQPLLRDTFTDMPAHTDMAAHNGHDSTHETNLHHGSNNKNDSSTIDCECCVTCVTMCATSGGTSAAIGTVSAESMFDNQGRPNPVYMGFHSNADPHSLFRPPKPNA